MMVVAGAITLPGVTINPGEDMLLEFDAAAPGLYRIDYALHRPGGAATYAWSIEKPIEKPLQLGQGGPAKPPALGGAIALSPAAVMAGGIVGYEITGWKPLIQGGPVLHTDAANATKHLAFFWLKAADVGWTRKLR